MVLIHQNLVIWLKNITPIFGKKFWLKIKLINKFFLTKEIERKYKILFITIFILWHANFSYHICLANFVFMIHFILFFFSELISTNFCQFLIHDLKLLYFPFFMFQPFFLKLYFVFECIKYLSYNMMLILSIDLNVSKSNNKNLLVRIKLNKTKI